MEELHAREQKMLEQVRELKQDKQRLEDTIYRLKTEAMATNVSQQKMKEALEKEREALVRSRTVYTPKLELHLMAVIIQGATNGDNVRVSNHEGSSLHPTACARTYAFIHSPLTFCS